MISLDGAAHVWLLFVCADACRCCCCLGFRLSSRAAVDPGLERCCVALRRQRKPIRQHIHRCILLKHVNRMRAIAEQISSKLCADEGEAGEGEVPLHVDYARGSALDSPDSPLAAKARPSRRDSANSLQSFRGFK